VKKLLLPVLLSLIFTTSISNAEITSFDEQFTVLCEIESSTGFNWSNGNWHQTKFTAGQQYIIKKESDEHSKDKYVSLCPLGFLKEEPRELPNWIIRDGCYSFKELKSNKNYSSEPCRERWSKDDMKLDRVSCPQSLGRPKMVFKPNGLIHIHKDELNLEANPKAIYLSNGELWLPADYKDSMYIAFGRCSTI